MTASSRLSELLKKLDAEPAGDQWRARCPSHDDGTPSLSIKEDEGKTSLDTANTLSPSAIDPNAYTPEYKGFLVKLEKA